VQSGAKAKELGLTNSEEPVCACGRQHGRAVPPTAVPQWIVADGKTAAAQDEPKQMVKKGEGHNFS
jgi:hypothetical protein